MEKITKQSLIKLYQDGNYNIKLYHKISEFLYENQQNKDAHYLMGVYFLVDLIVRSNQKPEGYISVLELFINMEKEYRNKDNVKEIVELTKRHFLLDGGYIHFLSFTPGMNSKYNHFDLVKRFLIHEYVMDLEYEKAYKVYQKTNFYKEWKYNEKLQELVQDRDIAYSLFELTGEDLTHLFLDLDQFGYEAQVGPISGIFDSLHHDTNYTPRIYTSTFIPHLNFISDLSESLIGLGKSEELKVLYKYLEYIKNSFTEKDKYLNRIMSEIEDYNSIKFLNEYKDIFDRVKDIDDDNYAKVIEKFDLALDTIYQRGESNIEKVCRIYNLDRHKLSDESLSFIATGDYVYKQLDILDNADYASAAICWCRAVEYELKSKLYTPISNTYSTEQIKSKVGLSNRDKLNRYFSMNYFNYLMFMDINGNHDQSKATNLKSLFEEFNLFTEYSYEEFIDFFKGIGILGKEYRNALSHTDTFGPLKAAECKNIVLITRQLLKKISSL